MAKNTAPTTNEKRKPRLLWANLFCLMDTSSGASMSVREMLRQLVAQGYEVMILGSTVFDNPKGAKRIQNQWSDIAAKYHQMAEVEDGELTHHLLVTQNTNRNALTTHEGDLWYSQYIYLLDSFKPDVVWFYGGQTLELLIPVEARARGIPSAFYLANGNYRSHFWNRDIDLILTDSQATADMYREKVGFAPKPIGKFIDSERFIAETHERKHLLFINPSWEKGASIVIQLALLLEKKRPEIILEVVEARGDWGALIRETTQLLGSPRGSLPNVVVTANTDDMRSVYSRARVLLAPSLWWESGARVLAEAMLNGIPAIVSNHGGSPGLIEDGGVVLDFPVACHEKPYKHLLNQEELQPIFDTVVGFYDDQALYDEFVERAYHVGKEKHHISISTRRLTQALSPLVAQKAGNKDFRVPQRKLHKHNLAGIASKPDFSQNAPAPATPRPTRQVSVLPAKASQDVAGKQASQTAEVQQVDFDWQLSSKIIALDNRAKLIHSGALNTLLATKAFSVIAFDPASDIKSPEQYEDVADLQLFPHALLGDGKPATLFACLDPAMTSTLAPLPSEQLSQHNRQGAQVIAKLPINTIALDSIEGLASLDWLILDDLSDASNILEHGETALKNTLLIQARVTFQPTHERQPDIAQLSHWAGRNGFRFYRLNDMAHRSMFNADKGASQRQASELKSADALFLPTPERLEAMTADQQRKLAFVLHTVFGAEDAVSRVLSTNNKLLAFEYHQFLKGVSAQAQAVKQQVQTYKKRLTPDELIALYLPDEMLEQPGSIRWLIEKEKQFGGLQSGVVRSKTSRLDPRKPHQYSAGFVKEGDEFLPTHIGGDRMSMNHHGYSIAYSTYLLPLIERKANHRLTIVEVGILRGTGLAIWCDLFPNARVIGLDLDPSIFESHRPVLEELGAFQKNKPEIYSFDQFAENRHKVRDILAGDKIDVFIDDGAHTYDAIMKTLDAVKPMLAADFVYFIEDFKSIDKAIKKILKSVNITYCEEMTVITPKNNNVSIFWGKKEFFKDRNALLELIVKFFKSQYSHGSEFAINSAETFFSQGESCAFPLNIDFMPKKVERVLILGSKPGANPVDGYDVVFSSNSSLLYHNDKFSDSFKVSCMSSFMIKKEGAESLKKYHHDAIIVMGNVGSVFDEVKILNPSVYVHYIGFEERRDILSSVSGFNGAIFSSDFFKIDGQDFKRIIRANFEFKKVLLGVGGENLSDWHVACRPSTGIISLLLAIKCYGESVRYYLSGVGCEQRSEYLDGHALPEKVKISESTDGLPRHTLADIKILNRLKGQYNIEIEDEKLRDKIYGEDGAQ